MNKFVSFIEEYCNAERIITVMVCGYPKMIAFENPGFTGGWHVKTPSGQEVGYFESLEQIKLSIVNN